MKCQAVSFGCVVAVATFLLPLTPLAQVAPGTPNFSAYDAHEIDSIDLMNNNIVLSVPVMGKSGAFPLQYSLVNNFYVFNDAGTWAPSGNSFSTSIYGFGANGLILFSTWSSQTTGVLCPDGHTLTIEMGNWFVQSPDGSYHYLPTNDFIDSAGCYSTSFVDAVTDDTGYILSVNLNATCCGYIQGIYDRGGTALGSPGVSLQATVKDTNGNSIIGNSTGAVYGTETFTDTLGLTALTVTTSQSATGANITSNWTDINGGSPQMTLSYTGSVTKQSNFGCTGIKDYDVANSQATATTIVFPDSTSINVTYEGTPQHSGSYTGRPHQLTLREGGIITYRYLGSHNGINCTYQTVPELQRVTSDGTTTYTLAYSPNGSNYKATNTVVDNGGNNTVYTFTGFTSSGVAAYPTAQVLTQVQHYQGSSTLLTTDTYCYNGNSTSCPATTVTYPIYELDVYHTVNGMAHNSRTQTQYDKYGNVTYFALYDFNASTPTKATTTTYGTCTANCTGASPSITGIGSNIYNKPGRIVITLNGNTVADSRFSYDLHGNLLTKYVWTGSQWLSNTTANVYNSNGTPSQIYDLANNETDYAYASGNYIGCNTGGNICTQFPFPTQVTNKGTGDYMSTVWYGVGGVKSTETDRNGVTNSYTNKTFTYSSSGGTADPFWRVMSVADSYGNTTYYTYPSGSTPAVSNSSFTFNSGNSINSITTTTDGYGRPTNLQKAQSPGGSSYDTASKSYGWTSNYRTVNSSQPCSTSVGSSCTTVHTKEYDPLGRLYTETTTSNETLMHTYTQNDDLAVLTPPPSGENSKQVQSEYDGLGRMTSSCRISSTVTGRALCNQATNTSAYGILTSISYSSAAGSSTVSSVRGSQTRTIILDALGRTIQKSTPEGGLWTYTYDSNSSCPTGYRGANGMLASSQDSNGNLICYAYDSMNRMTGVNANGNACRHFYYDNSSGYSGTLPSGVTLSNQYGRIVEAATDSCSANTLITDEWFAYDNDGRMTDMWEYTPHSTQYYHSVATFFGNGTVKTLQLASPSKYTITYTLDGEGRLYSVTDTTASQNLVASANYYPAYNPAVVNLTGTDSDATTFDANTGNITKQIFSVGSKNLELDLIWNANRTLQKLGIIDGFNSSAPSACWFNSSGAPNTGYDDLGRLVGEDCGSGQWGQTFTYNDAYDNLTKMVMSGHIGTTWNPGYSSTTNHCNICTYDSDGDVTSDGNYTYGWNEFAKLKWSATSGTPTCYTSGNCIVYDAFGRIVETTNGTSSVQRWITPLGETANMHTTGINFAYFPAPQGGTIVVNGNNISYTYLHKDWQGSSRVASSLTSNSVILDQHYSAFGEIFDQYGTHSNQFDMFASLTSNFYDGATWDTANRELSTVGRWLSPDPAGNGWNQYSYPTNPNSFIDPSGLVPCVGSGPWCFHGTNYNPGAGQSGITGADVYVDSNGILSDSPIFGTVGADSTEVNDYFNALANGTIQSDVTQERDDSEPSYSIDLSSFSGIFMTTPSPVFLMGCSGPGIPCYVVKTQYQPPRTTNAFQGYNYKVIDINGDTVRGTATEWVQELGIDSAYYPVSTSLEGDSWTDIVGWNGPTDEKSPDAFISAQVISFQVGGEGPDYLLNNTILHGAFGGGGIFSSFANVSYNTQYPLP